MPLVLLSGFPVFEPVSLLSTMQSKVVPFQKEPNKTGSIIWKHAWMLYLVGLIKAYVWACFLSMHTHRHLVIVVYISQLHTDSCTVAEKFCLAHTVILVKIGKRKGKRLLCCKSVPPFWFFPLTLWMGGWVSLGLGRKMLYFVSNSCPKPLGLTVEQSSPGKMPYWRH